MIFERDFIQERQDREKAHSLYAEAEKRYKHQLDSLSIQLIKVSQELSSSHMSTADRGKKKAILKKVSAILTVVGK